MAFHLCLNESAALWLASRQSLLRHRASFPSKLGGHSTLNSNPHRHIQRIIIQTAVGVAFTARLFGRWGNSRGMSGVPVIPRPARRHLTLSAVAYLRRGTSGCSISKPIAINAAMANSRSVNTGPYHPPDCGDIYRPSDVKADCTALRFCRAISE